MAMQPPGLEPSETSCSCPSVEAQNSIEGLLRVYHDELLRRLDKQDQQLAQLGNRSSSKQRSPPTKIDDQLSYTEASFLRTGSPATSIRLARANTGSSATSEDPCPPEATLAGRTLEATLARQPAMAPPRSESVNGRVKQPLARRLATSPTFETLFGVAILLNGLIMGVEVGYQAERGGEPVPSIFSILNHSFTIIFLFELLVRMASEGKHFLWNHNMGWNILDTVLVISSIFELVADIIRGLDDVTEDSETSGFNLASIRLLRVIRVTRLIRLLRMARIVHFIKDLGVLVASIMLTLKALVWAMILLGMNIYLFAILFTQIATPELLGLPSPCSEVCEAHQAALMKYWGSLPLSMLTLFASVTGGLDWWLVSEPLMRISLVYMLMFLLYISVTVFAMLNVITGFFCQSAIEGTQQDRDFRIRQIFDNKQMHISHIKEQFQAMFEHLDSDGSGAITAEGFKEHIDNKEGQGFFALLDIAPSDAFMLFTLLDADDSNMIDAEEFVDGCLRLKGPTKAIDFACFQKDFKRQQEQTAKVLGAQDRLLKALGGELSALRRIAAAIVDQQAQSRRDTNATFSSPSLKQAASLSHEGELSSIGLGIALPLLSRVLV
mmetsp:Transcript_152366/g.486839  ORF Transcript_152366/g.486839 Transcript_152366/m.486839 type:complete len:610 (-) Transcript_152366:90-1919(-)